MRAEEQIELVLQTGHQDPYIITIYYNLAYLNQKIGRLNECGRYLEKAMSHLDNFVRQTDLKKSALEFPANLSVIFREQMKRAKTSASVYLNDALMKY